MALSVNVSDEPLTPAGRLFLQPEMKTIIHCALGVKHHMDRDAIKSTIKNSFMVKHPRFCSLLVRDKNGFEHWRRTEIDIDRHIILVDETAATNGGDDVDKIVNDYIADLSSSSPLGCDKPLWEIHMMMKQKCAIFRIHHALGDGISLMSMLLAICRKAEDPAAVPTLAIGGRRDWSGEKGKDWRGALMGVLKMVLFNLVFCLNFVLRCLCVRDRKTVISGGDGVELWPRKVATARFWIEDMKMVKQAVANARAKAMIDRKKQTLEAQFSYRVGDLAMSWLGPKIASLLNYRILCNTTFTISNVVGPKEEITLAGNPITFIRANTSSLPQAVAMHMVSYAGRAEMQIVVAKDIIPDPEFLAKCFQDSLLEMKEAAIASI
ncbi:hypothetical protein GH714_033813 [Hevea brasiliensis]|uniref:Uncharacterized protein n=1 Tax=Hevea brasiliensis TaxID=3981 RepID=A0A6A6N4M0_HEVBR|nr:hypothetical protein GH714_033813 [Hevea brasiliensis]